MSVQIKVKWFCGACESENFQYVRKPDAIQPTVCRKVCETCESNFLIRFSKVRGQQSILCESIDVRLSPKGEATIKRREEN